MINNTLLILGAGSSAECGFPVGEKLIRDIYEFVKGSTEGYKRDSNHRAVKIRLENKQLIWRLLERKGLKKADGFPYGVEDVEKFGNALCEAHPRSIDEFLHDRKEFSDIGKICILYCLSKYEDEKGLKPVFSDNKYCYPNLDWYKYLWHSLTDGAAGNIEEFKKNRLKVITFNYDRSLEEFLLRAIRSKFGLTDWEAFELFKKTVDIKHVYGNLGVSFEEFNYSSTEDKEVDVTWIEGSPRPMPYKPYDPAILFRLWGGPGEYGATDMDVLTFRFGQESDQLDLAKIIVERAMRIKTYNENFKNEMTTKFRNIIKNAENIIFLGFAFHSQNLKVLGLGPNLISKHTKVYGTAYGLSNPELEEKRQIIRAFIDLPERVQIVVKIYNQWDGLDENKSIIKSFFKNVDGVRLK